MRTNYLIAVDEFCTLQNIELSFINSLHEAGLIEIITKRKKRYIDFRQTLQLEKFIRFHYDFEINLEGIETISHLLERIIAMQDRITALKNKLRLYETND
ncbi:MAG: chaperone modulator CbpM [Bacteroidales bacterium]|jgi:hypothetical protein